MKIEIREPNLPMKLLEIKNNLIIYADQGPKGDKGDKGDQGEQGIQGIQGLKGDKGDTGDQGLQGPQGIQGPQGLKGDKGETGDQGIQGIQGLKGDKGDKGDTGDQGIQGLNGDKGDKGDTGDQGIQGPMQPKELILNVQTASYLPTLADQASQTMIRMNLASAGTFTLPPNSSVAFPLGTQFLLSQAGAGQVTITPGAGVTLNAADGDLKTRVQYSVVGVIKTAIDTWIAFGDLTA